MIQIKTMKKQLTFITLVFLILGVGMAQKQMVPASLVTKKGDTITGFVKQYYQNSVGVRFRLYDKKMEFIKVKAKDYQSMQIDSNYYEVHPTKLGGQGFMREIVKGGKASLFGHYLTTSYNGGFGLSSASIIEYYIMKAGKIYPVIHSTLRDHPERYFGGVPHLVKEIRGARIPEQEKNIARWTRIYNKYFENQ